MFASTKSGVAMGDSLKTVEWCATLCSAFKLNTSGNEHERELLHAAPNYSS